MEGAIRQVAGGELRWRAPSTPSRKAPAAGAEFGNACASNGWLSAGANNDQSIATTYGTPVGSEDCLYLNIWQPTDRDSGHHRQRHDDNLPVICFVHGGTNITGYTADPVYDGATLARTAKAVVVTANYRLSIFGFFNQPTLKTGDPLQDSGNFALLDLMKALSSCATTSASSAAIRTMSP
jgi:carboxylesterase type B